MLYECGPERNAKEIAEILRDWLPPLLQKYDIQEISDLGCGDLYWFSMIDFRGIYRGYDEVLRMVAVERAQDRGWGIYKIHFETIRFLLRVVLL